MAYRTAHCQIPPDFVVKPQAIDVAEVMTLPQSRRLDGGEQPRGLLDGPPGANARKFTVSVTDCNRNGSGLQSTEMWDQIIYIYPSLQDRIICN